VDSMKNCFPILKNINKLTETCKTVYNDLLFKNLCAFSTYKY